MSSFTFVAGDPFYRIQQAIGFIPRGTRGVRRRLILFLCVGWLPLVILAGIDTLVLGRTSTEPLLAHFGVHARFLVAIPLFLLAEVAVESVAPAYLAHFVTTGIVDPQSLARFQEIVTSAERLKNSWMGFAVAAALAAAAVFKKSWAAVRDDEISWAVFGQALSIAGWWYIYVSVALFALLLAVWAWRLLVGVILLVRVARLDLRLVPTHPDRAGGLGFLGELPVAFAPFVLGLSAVIASQQGHYVAYHGLQVNFINPIAAGICLISLLLFVGPLLIFYPRLRKLKLRSLLEYGRLLGRHGELVERKWIRGEPVGDEPMLQAPELGPLADVNTVYRAVEELRVVPFGKRAVLAIGIASLLPFLPVYAIQIPIRDLLLKIAGSLL